MGGRIVNQSTLETLGNDVFINKKSGFTNKVLHHLEQML